VPVIVFGGKVGLTIVDVDFTNITGGIMPTIFLLSSLGGK
jgi:hypothetical protein